MLKKLAVLLVLSAMVGVGLAQSVTVGVNLELSGRFAAIGQTTLQGIEAALEQSTLADDIGLSVCDNQTTVEGSVACANRFVDEGVVAVLGAISSSMSIPAAEVLQDAGIIMISTSSTNNATTQIGDLIYRMAYNDEFQGSQAATYMAEELGADRVAIFRQQDDDYSFGLSGFVADTLSELGVEHVVVDFVANTVDFSAQINDIRNYDADVIYWAGFCAEGAAAIPQLRQQGFDQTIMGADASDDPQCIEGGGEAFDEFIFTGFAGPDELVGEAAERAAEFQAFYEMVHPDGAFNGFTLAGADSMNVIIEAVENASGTSVPEVNEALSSVEGYPGVSGDITYVGTDGTPANRALGLFEYEFDLGDTYGEAKTSVTTLGVTGGN